MLDPDVTVSKIVEDRRVSRDGVTFSEIRVEFRVGEHGPFIEQFPKNTYSKMVRDQKLNDFARDIRTTP